MSKTWSLDSRNNCIVKLGTELLIVTGNKFFHDGKNQVKINIWKLIFAKRVLLSSNKSSLVTP